MTACANPALRTAALTPDQAPLETCPAALDAPPTLAPLDSFLLPDGRAAVLLDTVIARETATAHYIIAVRGGWHECRSAVEYVQDWSARVKAAR